MTQNQIGKLKYLGTFFISTKWPIWVFNFCLDDNPLERSMLPRVGCAYSHNTERTRQTFEFLCPEGFEGYSIAPSRTNKKPYCRWIVNYRSYLPCAAAKRAIDILLTHQPNKAYALTKPRCEGSQDVLPSWKIEYGVRCTCQKNFRKPLTQSVLDVDVNSLKLE
jgi:hypothetical protein